MRATTSNPLINNDIYNIALHTTGLTVGPMPVPEFLDKFLPGVEGLGSRTRRGISSRLPANRVNDTFVATVGPLCPGFELVPLTSSEVSYDDWSSDAKASPDIAIYPAGLERQSPCDWSLMDLFVEWRLHRKRDGYRDAPGDTESLDHSSRRALKLRGQLFTFAARIINSQHRLFLFAVDISSEHARLYRFDSSCVVISEPIPYHKDSRLLDAFFLRYSAASPAERGHDPTIIPATDTEKTLFHTRVREYLERAEKNNLRAHPDAKKMSDKPVFRVQVNDLDGKIHWYLASRPGDVSGDRPPCGRFTRGFLSTPAAVETENKKTTTTENEGNLFWLKDSWRPSCDEAELSIYNKLKAKGIPNLPDIICAGDIQDGDTFQTTLNDTVASESNHARARPSKPIRGMVHHRIVSRLLIPLTSVRNAKELLLVGRDILTTIATAFHQGNIYHRDISLGNVMMTEQQGDDHKGPWGVLNDWDHALWTDASPTDRVGTWQFISTRLLDNVAKPHDIFDDLESLLWVMLFLAVHRFNHEGFIRMLVFDEASMRSDPVRGKIASGGYAKKTWLARPGITFECKPLQQILNSFRCLHRDRRYKYSISFESKEGKKEYDDFEAGIKKNVYELLSYFDDVLNDPDIDWTGQEVQIQNPRTQQSPNIFILLDRLRRQNRPVPQNRPIATVEEKKPELKPPVPPSGNRAAKRKQEELQMDRSPGTKRSRRDREHQTRDEAKPVVRAPRRRRPPPPPSDRVLRPRPCRR